MCGASFHPSRISGRCIGEDDFIFDSAVMDSEDVYAVNEHPPIVCKLAKHVTLHRHLCLIEPERQARKENVDPFHEVKSKREKKNEMLPAQTTYSCSISEDSCKKRKQITSEAGD
ncbi:hypothetical protein L1887_02639 [Cichorium endivia]|nr:hypothetical protein L1887_02639 [Cichorium endivia]